MGTGGDLFMNYRGFWLFSMILGLFILSGCETGRNYQGDIDSLNAKVSSLQSQSASKDEEISKLRGLESRAADKDQEIAKLQNQLNAGQQQIARLESDKKALTAKLGAAKAKPAKDFSDLK
jgi:outer membrane murein-binding lipoprotein Lpp